MDRKPARPTVGWASFGGWCSGCRRPNDHHCLPLLAHLAEPSSLAASAAVDCTLLPRVMGDSPPLTNIDNLGGLLRRSVAAAVVAGPLDPDTILRGAVLLPQSWWNSLDRKPLCYAPWCNRGGYPAEHESFHAHPRRRASTKTGRQSSCFGSAHQPPPWLPPA